MTLIDYNFIKSISNSDNNSNDHIIKIVNYSNLTLIKYKKNSLRNIEDFEKYGLLRSVILHNNKIVSVSPGKSLRFDDFKNKYNPNECIAEEFVEGTMINLFYTDEHGWHISTRSNIGGNNIYFKRGKMNDNDTFAYMFSEVCKDHCIDYDKLSKNCCYSFVFQHPHNRIVKKINEMKLYLIAAYEIGDNYLINKITIDDEFINTHFTNNGMKIYSPKKYNFSNYNELENMIANKLNYYENVGIMLHDKNGHNRTKIRNDEYENVRKLKGNQPKLQFHHLELKKTNDVNEYLKYFPEDTELFKNYDKKFNTFKNTLLKLYISCFIYKNKHLKEYPIEYKNHLYQLYENYKNTGQRITSDVINKYIQNADCAQILYTINFSYR